MPKFVQSPEDKANWRWHAFRRFYISARLAMGADFMTVGEQVGHRDASITARTYARALPEPPPIWRYRFSPADPRGEGHRRDRDRWLLSAAAGRGGEWRRRAS